MLQLSIPDKLFVDEYERTILPDLIKRVKNGNNKVALSDDVKEILMPGYKSNPKTASERILKELLTSLPENLLRLHSQLGKDIKDVDTKNGSNDYDKLLTIFGYETVYNSKSKSKAYWLARKIGRNTCTYCNRQYIFTVVRGEGNNKEERITRPEFDHWFPKDEYPLLSMSLYNLIPSCHICNSSAKGMTSPSLGKHIHPYVHPRGGLSFRFTASKTIESLPQWSIKIVRKEGSKEDETIKMFCLDEIYAMHNDLEVRDIMLFIERYRKEYIQDLCKNMLNDEDMPLTQSDVYRMLFGVDGSKNHILDRPLGKMKLDLLEEYGIRLI